MIAYSRRYHWPNLPPGKDADASVERQAGDLAAIIQAMGIAPAHTVGHSYGGAVALDLTLRPPELVRTLVLAEPAVSGVLGHTLENDAVSKESQTVRAEMKEAFATGDAERIVRTYAARVAPGEFEKAPPEVRQMLVANVPAFQLDLSSRRSPFYMRRRAAGSRADLDFQTPPPQTLWRPLPLWVALGLLYTLLGRHPDAPSEGGHERCP